MVRYWQLKADFFHSRITVTGHRSVGLGQQEHFVIHYTKDTRTTGCCDSLERAEVGLQLEDLSLVLALHGSHLPPKSVFLLLQLLKHRDNKHRSARCTSATDNIPVKVRHGRPDVADGHMSHRVTYARLCMYNIHRYLRASEADLRH